MVEQLTAEQFEQMQASGEEFTLIDTRPNESYGSWHAVGARSFPFSTDESLTEGALDEFNGHLDKTDPIITICAKGITSNHLAEEFEQHGFENVKAVEGGMEAWSQVYHVVPIEINDEELELFQLQRRAKGCLGYIVGSKREGIVAAVDVTRQTNEFKTAAEDAGYEIAHVLDTHIHADHISGGRQLATELGVPYYLSENAAERDVQYEYEPLERNEVLEIGAVDLKAVFTPGHTTEITSYLLNDDVILTGDTLFTDSIGRTELEFGEKGAGKGAEMQYDSLHKTIMSEPDTVTVLPGHVTVTEEGEYKNGTPNQPVQSSVGAVRRQLDVLQLDEEAFVDQLVENIPEKPPNYETVIATNTGQESIEDEQEATELELGPNRCAVP